jgi:hypothetical protein
MDAMFGKGAALYDRLVRTVLHNEPWDGSEAVDMTAGLLLISSALLTAMLLQSLVRPRISPPLSLPPLSLSLSPPRHPLQSPPPMRGAGTCVPVFWGTLFALLTTFGASSNRMIGVGMCCKVCTQKEAAKMV